ncbi:MAG: tRNA uridine-5-carboxymethylaminomethyl(34) synthesis GTPase MnmE, partial [Ginsengibacter sp.]
MQSKLSGWNDTIAAIATPPGIGAIGVLRLSGNDAFDIIQKIFPSKNLKSQPANTLHVGYLKDGETVLDEVVISLFKKPASYTGEDVIEISCHGSPYVQQQVLDALIRKGARLAKAGEFTQRAFLNKKLDLTQAEAVGDLIASNTKAAQNAALKNMRGGFSNVLHNLREELIKFSSLIELELDFSEEDVEFADRLQFSLLIENISGTVKKLLESFKLGNVIKNGVSVAIVGKPNAGKSTLLNTLLNENRAIVSDIAGTTRDTIEEVININGILFRLIDTAGIREHSTDIIENMGVEKSRAKIKQADIVLYLFDVNEMQRAEVEEIIMELKRQNANVIAVGNKADILNTIKRPDFSIQISISAREGTGIEELKSTLFQMAGGESINSENVVVTNARHHAALTEIL